MPCARHHPLTEPPSPPLDGNASVLSVRADLDVSGSPTGGEKRLSAVLEILEVPTATQPGRAVISVAWPAQAGPE